MRLMTLALVTSCLVTTLGATAPYAIADEGWRWHEYRERHGRDGWRERQWQEHERRDHYYRPPVVLAPPHGYYAPPPVYYPGPGYYR